MPFPDISPIAFQIGPLAIRWYSLAYIAGIVIGWWLVLKLHKKLPIPNLSAKAIDDMIVWAVIGVVGGGRLGYVLFYKPAYFLVHPLEIFQIWQGGMSFHGGMVGTILAFWLFCRKHGVPFWRLMDVLACAAPIGLFLGRLANFANGELYGRITTSAWGVVFPMGGELPRHPSQLYEAALEGVALFIVLFTLAWCTRARAFPGMLCGLFLIGYGFARIIAECFREPDAHLGFLFAHITMGQVLSVPMVLLGIAVTLKSLRRVPASAA